MGLYPSSDDEPINTRMHHLAFACYSPTEAASFMLIHLTVTGSSEWALDYRSVLKQSGREHKIWTIRMAQMTYDTSETTSLRNKGTDKATACKVSVIRGVWQQGAGGLVQCRVAHLPRDVYSVSNSAIKLTTIDNFVK
jgi:hypothetical protein